MKVLSITIIMVGILLLAFSLYPTINLCRRERKFYFPWRVLGILIFLFIIGYLLFLAIVFQTSFSSLEMIVTGILFIGAVFVVIVVSVSHTSIRMSEHQALHDKLTSLPNRLLVEERLDHGLKIAKRHRKPLAFLLMDLVRFKEINDSLGHFYGDYLLQEVAHRLTGVVRESDTLARFGGDEFALVLLDTSLEQAAMISMKIADSLEQPFLIEGNNLRVGISIGIAMYPEHGSESGTLIQSADVAMYEAKRNDTLYATFNDRLQKTSFNRLILIGELRDAINRRDIYLTYQPKVAASDMSLVGVEVLSRWEHQDRGFISPDVFVPLAEQSGLINQFTNMVLDKALEQCAQWLQEGRYIPISVNLSIKNLHNLDFPKSVAKLLHKWDVKPEMLLFEITESSIILDRERVSQVMDDLKKMNLQFSIDDYGTGYSSIAYMKKFPADEIKIDKSFIIDLLQNGDNAEIVKSSIDLIHTIGRKVVAEGVEDEETLEYLIQLGCDIIQGFHICHPLENNELIKWSDTKSENENNKFYTKIA